MEWILSVGDSWLVSLAWLLGLAAFFGIAARLMPCNPGVYWWSRLRAAGTDLMYWFVAPVIVRLCRTAILAVGVSLLLGGRESLFSQVNTLPLWFQCVAVLVIQDVLLYWVHRLFHTRLAWKFHAIHHSPTVLDWLSASRFHLVNVLLSFCLADVVVLLLGFSPAALLLLVPVNIIYSAMVHANLNWTFGPLRYLFASPVFHRWHHTTEAEGLDKNFASTFPVLDVVFGTFHMPPGKLPENFGTGDHVPEDFWGQLLHPFRGADGAPLFGRSLRIVAGAGVALAVVGVMAFSAVRGLHTRARDGHSDQARDHFEEGDFDHAIAASTEAIRDDPDCAMTYANRAASHLQKGDTDRAIGDCTRAIELDPRLALAYANRGGARLNRGELQPAIDDCTHAIELEPGLALAYANRAGAHLNLGANDQAVADCDEALKLDPAQTTVYFTRAGAYFGKGDHEASIRDWDEVLRLDPERTLAYANRAAAQLAKGNVMRAIVDYTESLRRDPTLAVAELNRAIAFVRIGDNRSALRGFDRAIELEPTLAVAHAYRAALSLESGNPERVIADCTRAVELDPRLALSYYVRSQAYARKGDSAHAEADRKKAHELNPDFGAE